MFSIEIKVNNKQIDKYQKKVINSRSQNILVLAGAGSGKTFTIIAKIKKIIINGIMPEDILCISFTKAAAQSLEEKLKKEKIMIKVRTFHSLGYEIIKKIEKVNLADEKTLQKIINKNIFNYKFLNEIVDTKFIRFGHPDSIFNKLENNIIINSKYKIMLEKTIISFISLYKSGNYKIKDFKSFDKINRQTHIYNQKYRHHLFLKLVKKIIIEYEKELKKNRQIDFHDMINKSTAIIKKIGIHQYKYIIIDEYQDTSLNKTLLIKEIQNKTNAKLMAVGDDWQSIYSFTGSNLDIFINFKKIFSNSKIIKLKRTYRNPKELLNITRKFICENPKQINKKLKTNKTNKYPIHIYFYNENIKEVWDKIETHNKKTLILGRNNKDISLIPNIKKNMKFMTIHKAKGLESEYTIIINLENQYNSLPNKIKDSEYLKYVNPSLDSYKYSEERRLFYVALTRCKNTNYLLVNKNNPSEFILELIKKYSKNIKIN